MIATYRRTGLIQFAAALALLKVVLYSIHRRLSKIAPPLFTPVGRITNITGKVCRQPGMFLGKKSGFASSARTQCQAAADDWSGRVLS